MNLFRNKELPIENNDESDEESSSVETDEEKSRGRRWFSFLRRHNDSDDDSYDDEDEDDDDDMDDHQLNDGDSNADLKSCLTATNVDCSGSTAESIVIPKEEDVLLAQAILRVQQRIIANGGEGTVAEIDSNIDTKVATADFQGRYGDDVLKEEEGSTFAPVDSTHKNHSCIQTQLRESLETVVLEENLDEGLRSSQDSPQIDVGTIKNDQSSMHKNKPDDLVECNENQDSHDNDEQPTIEEQHSLLSLAAEHNRVDVIKELLTTSPSFQQALLTGVTSQEQSEESIEKENDLSTFFVPPPLHVAVAHGSVDAASCLLRMGADPSIRPVVPEMRNHSPPSERNSFLRSGSQRSADNTDRNYRKYHTMSAWELAFGSLIKISNDDNQKEAEEHGEEEEVIEKKSWFSFGYSKSSSTIENDDSREVDIGNSSSLKKPQYKKKSPLNIAPSKLEGILNAFGAEALRAIGSDEVTRLSQLLDAGMTPALEVAGKTLSDWALEMDSKECFALIRLYTLKDECNERKSTVVSEDEGKIESSIEISRKEKESLSVDEVHQSPSYEAEALKYTVQDDRLIGVSYSDLEILIHENLSLIPGLTSCRDSLVDETSMCRNIIRDIQASSGKGGLSSRSLLEMVRTLKDQRQVLEDTLKQWEYDWNEREDELDFFWEEVIDDDLRAYLIKTGVLERVNVDPPPVTFTTSLSTLNFEELVKRFNEVANTVRTLRSSIASLAEESTYQMQEIERNNMAGALSLVKSLRDEVKELEEKISDYKSGEDLCRRKIQLIQKIINHPTTVSSEELSDSMNDYQLKAIFENQDHERRSPLAEEEYCPENHSNVISTTQAFEDQPDALPERRVSIDEENIGNNERMQDETYHYSDNITNDGSLMIRTTEKENSIDDNSCEVTESITVNSARRNVLDSSDKFLQDEQMSINNHDSNDVNTVVEHLKRETCNSHQSNDDKMRSHHQEDITADFCSSKDNHTLKPSDAVISGMSSAIVLRPPNGRASSLSFQIWDLLRRIVGLSRSVSIASSTYHECDIDNSRHIMIV